MTDVKFDFPLAKLSGLTDWLHANMPNPPFPKTQRWFLIEVESDDDGLACMRFFNDEDAILFALRWGQ